MDDTIRFTVFGIPQSRGSKRAYPIKRRDGSLGVAVADDNVNSRDWMNSIRTAALEAYSGELIRGPVILSILFNFPRRKGHFRTGKNSKLLKSSAPLVPAGKPDLLKLARAVEDALTGIVYVDDAQIVEELLAKHYGEPACAEIHIIPV